MNGHCKHIRIPLPVYSIVLSSPAKLSLATCLMENYGSLRPLFY